MNQKKLIDITLISLILLLLIFIGYFIYIFKVYEPKCINDPLGYLEDSLEFTFGNDSCGCDCKCLLRRDYSQPKFITYYSKDKIREINTGFNYPSVEDLIKSLNSTNVTVGE